MTEQDRQATRATLDATLTIAWNKHHTSAASIARTAGLHPTRLSQVRTGLETPRQNELLKLCAALDAAGVDTAALRNSPGAGGNGGRPDLFNAARNLQRTVSDWEIDRAKITITITGDGSVRRSHEYLNCQPASAEVPAVELIVAARADVPSAERPSVTITEKPEGLDFAAVTTEYDDDGRRAEARIKIERGWRRGQPPGHFSFAFSSTVERNFRPPTLRDIEAGERGAIRHTVTHHLETLELVAAAAWPAGLTWGPLEASAWPGAEPWRPGRVSVLRRGIARDHTIQASGPENPVRLIVEQPLIGYTYALAWGIAARKGKR